MKINGKINEDKWVFLNCCWLVVSLSSITGQSLLKFPFQTLICADIILNQNEYIGRYSRQRFRYHVERWSLDSPNQETLGSKIPCSCTSAPSWACAGSPSCLWPPSSVAPAAHLNEDDSVQKASPPLRVSARFCSHPGGWGRAGTVAGHPGPPRRPHTGAWPRSRARWRSACTSWASPSGRSSASAAAAAAAVDKTGHRHDQHPVTWL